MSIHSRVRIEMTDGPTVCGNTKIFVDDVEQKHIFEAVLQLRAGDVAQLTLKSYVETVFDGITEVNRITVCPECRKEAVAKLEAGNVAVVDITNLDSKYKQNFPIGHKNEDGSIEL